MKNHSILAGLLALILLPLIASDGESSAELAITQNLAEDGLEAASGQRILLLLVSREDCSYCEVMKREVLNPMVISGDYESRLIFRELLIDIGERVGDFNGRQQAAATFAYNQGISLTPTLLFLAPSGEELAERIIGVRTLSMLPSYVDANIDTALAKLRRANRPQ
jgi:thioredoxin-related protein